MASFDSLSADLRLMILFNLHSPAEVYATIRASRPYYQVFQAYGPTILYSSLQKAVAQEAFGDMILACEAGDIASLIGRPKNYIVARRNEFLAHMEYQASFPPRPEDLSVDLHSLCRLWLLVDYFVQDYAQFALEELSTYSKLVSEVKGSPLTDCTYAISHAEYGRIQRTFFRFELYRRLFGCHDEGSRVTRTPDSMSLTHKDFFEEFFPWEKSELRSIRNYLHLKMKREMIEKLEDYLVDKIEETAQEGVEYFDVFTRPFPLEVIGLQVFADKGSKQYQVVDYMVELGLPFIKTVFEMTLEDRLSIVTLFPKKRRNPCLLFAMIRFPVWDGGNTAVFNPESFTNHPRAPNSGWRWLHWDSDPLQSHLTFNLDPTGYIFWDKIRLEKAGLFQNSLPAPLKSTRDHLQNLWPSVNSRTHYTEICDRRFLQLEPEVLIKDVDMGDWLANLEY